MRTSGGEQKECSRYLWKDLSQVQEQKRYVANLAVLGTVDMLDNVSEPPNVKRNVLEPRLARIWIGTLGVRQPQRDVIPLDHTTIGLLAGV